MRCLKTSPCASLSIREVIPAFSTGIMVGGTLSDPNVLSKNCRSFDLWEVRGKRLCLVFVIEKLTM